MNRAFTVTGMIIAPIFALLGLVLAQGEPWGIWILGAMVILEAAFITMHLRSRHLHR